MANMSYCRFRNTLTDLRDCEEHLDDRTDDMDEDELVARQRLINTCVRIAEAYGDSDEEEE